MTTDKQPNSKTKRSKIVIRGVTISGETFRPSDWAERMSGKLSTFNNKHRIIYSPMLRPTMEDGDKCVILDTDMQEKHPALFESILKFAKKNNLQICYIDEDGKPLPEENINDNASDSSSEDEN